MAKAPVIEVGKSASKQIATPSPHRQMNVRIGNVERLVTAVLWLGLITLIGVLVAVSTLVIDQEHFNNETYREQTTNLQTQIQVLQDEIRTLKQ